jgi:uncharacterized lipoprotein YbaY
MLRGMKRWFPLVLVLLAGCSALPEDQPLKERLAGTLAFSEMTALPETATAHVVVVPAQAAADSKPVAEADFPARTGTGIPFELKIPAAKLAGNTEYLVLAQVLDHGKVWYSNLSSPLRISFIAEPGDVVIEMRKEKF